MNICFFFFPVICNWSFATSSKKPSDVERAFVSDSAQHYNLPVPTTGVSNTQVNSIGSLDEALTKIKELETRLKELEHNIPKKYPEVKFLTYKDRKRILVSGYKVYINLVTYRVEKKVIVEH